MLEKTRNIAIIAHVDHGKTTIIDSIFKQSNNFRDSQLSDERIMDNNAIEKERGITIFSKCTSITYNDYTINIIDTPGHADFGGEVERVLCMVDSCLLLVDSAEGVMPQTKFVLGKALKQGLRPIVVINKIDKPDQRAKEVVEEIFDLFVNLDATDEQLDFPILYASGRDGWASEDINQRGGDLRPLLDKIIDFVPCPDDKYNDGEFRFLATMLEQDNFLGRVLTGKIYSGTAKLNQQIQVLDLQNNVVEKCKITRIQKFVGLSRESVQEAEAGSIVTIAGCSVGTVSNTLCSAGVKECVPSTPIDPPTLSMTIGPNTSPFAGKSGNKLTSNMIKDRLEKEAETNIAITIKESSEKDSYEVGGRGELQLGVLIETMRREGFELSVARPKVMIHIDENGNKTEPIEEITMDVDDEFTGTIIQKLQNRKGEMTEMKPFGVGRTRLVFLVPTRCLMGYQSEFMTDTRGTGVFNRIFHSYAPFKGDLQKYRNGVLISTENGVATAYDLWKLEDRGVMFVKPQDEVYVGMILGEHNRENDLPVNVVRGKHLTNVRASGSDEAVKLIPAKEMTLEQMIAYIQDDELIEVTPDKLRLRKKYLDPNERKKAQRG
ncbi:MAG: translational GTPase TypA [Rickettsiales bacterium]|nr:translational GTPase TypA [Rickettsiales bacterium]